MITTLRSPDGTKRRRRSQQPIYASRRRRRRWLIIGISVVTLGLVSYFGIGLFQKIRLEGETFRDGLNRRISEALGCKVEFNRIFDGGDKSLAATEARIETREQTDLIQSATFNSLSASLTSTSWVTDQWGILMLSVTDGTIHLNPDRPALPPTGALTAPGSKGTGRTSEGKWRFGINPEPDSISIDKLQFTKGFNLEWPANAPLNTEAVRKLRGHVKFPRSGDLSGGMEGSFNDGTLVLAEMPELRVESVRWTLKERHLEIQGGRVSFDGKASASISGRADLVKDGSIEIKADFVPSPLSAILPRVWHEAVLGMFSAEKTTFRSSFGNGPERVFEGDFTVAGALFQGFHFMSKIADAFGRPEFGRPEFPTLNGHFKWSPSTGLEITGISAEKEGLLRLNGSVAVNNKGSVSGHLRVSASETVLRNAPATAPKIFGPVAGEWTSIEFEIKGDSKSIIDDIVMPGSTAAIKPDPSPVPGVVTPAAPQAPARTAPPPGKVVPTAPPPPKKSNVEIEKELEELLRANKSNP